MEAFLGILRRKVEKWRKDFNKRENEACEKMRTYLHTSQAKDSTDAQRVKALIGEQNLYESGDRYAYDLTLLEDIHVLGDYVNVNSALINKLDEELEESGIREVLKHVKTIKELVDTINGLKEQAETDFENAQERQKKRKRKLSYIA